MFRRKILFCSDFDKNVFWLRFRRFCGNRIKISRNFFEKKILVKKKLWPSRSGPKSRTFLDLIPLANWLAFWRGLFFEIEFPLRRKIFYVPETWKENLLNEKFTGIRQILEEVHIFFYLHVVLKARAKISFIRWS